MPTPNWRNKQASVCAIQLIKLGSKHVSIIPPPLVIQVELRSNQKYPGRFPAPGCVASVLQPQDFELVQYCENDIIM